MFRQGIFDKCRNKSCNILSTAGAQVIFINFLSENHIFAIFTANFFDLDQNRRTSVLKNEKKI